MAFEVSLWSAIPLMFGLGIGLAAFGILAEQRRRMTARRIAAFVGTPIELPSRPPPSTLDWRLYNLSASVFASPSRVQAVLLGVVGAGLAIGVVFGSSLGFTVAAVTGLAVLILISRAQTQARIERQAPSAVRLMASGLRAGFSIPQALALVARESPEPTAAEFKRAAQEVELGSSLDSALVRLAERATRDYALVATIVSVEHEVGGNMALALDAVSETLRERADLSQYAATLTAQQRLSSLILTALPIVLFLYMLVVNRAYVEPLFGSLLGRLLLLLTSCLLVVGWVAMNWLGRIEE